MEYIFGFKPAQGIFALPCAAVDQYIDEATCEDLKVLLYVFRSGGASLSRGKIAGALKLREELVDRALEFWAERGFFSYRVKEDGLRPQECSAEERPLTASPDKPSPAADRAAPPNDIPAAAPVKKRLETPVQYSAGEISKKSEQNPDFRFLLDTVPELLGRLLSPSECSTLLWLHEGAGLPADVILMLIEYCVSSGHTNMRYIEKAALTWADEGINTHERADSKIRELESRRSYEGQIRALMGVGDRAFTAAERQHLTRWSKEWSIPVDMVRQAYEICVNRTGKLSFSYINSILKSWHEKGIRTPEQAQREQSGRKDSKTSYNVDEYVKLSMKRLMDE